ncbi:MAG: PilZ domain-containing protein [Deltaproteobacteria bacterium]|nr:PilZ domain-containing protein [Deltaproteobacteria bacterium]
MSTEAGPTTQKRSTPKIERRKSRRDIVYMRYPVLVLTESMHEKGEEPVAGVITDLSKAGAGIITSFHIPAGSRVKIILQSRAEFDRELSMTAIWGNLLPSANRIIKATNNFWRNGLHFASDADQEQQDFITALLKALQG